MSPDDSGVRVRLVASAADREAAFAIRRAVFQEEQGVPGEIEFEEAGIAHRKMERRL